MILHQNHPLTFGDWIPRVYKSDMTRIMKSSWDHMGPLFLLRLILKISPGLLGFHPRNPKPTKTMISHFNSIKPMSTNGTVSIYHRVKHFSIKKDQSIPIRPISGCRIVLLSSLTMSPASHTTPTIRSLPRCCPAMPSPAVEIQRAQVAGK